MEYLTNTLSTFLESVGGLLPGVLGAILVLIIGWFIAGGLSRLTRKLLSKTNLDNRVFKSVSDGISPEKFLSKLVYYLVMLIVLLIVLEMLGVSQVLDPLKNMVNEFFGFIPNLIAAGLIGFIGFIIATFVSELVGLGASTINNFSSRFGMSAEESGFNIVNVLKKVVFIFIFVPILIAALDALNISAISEPATHMLSVFINAIPNIFAAVLIIGVFYIVGRFITGLLKDILSGMGVDNMSQSIGLGSVLGNQSMSGLLSNVAFFFIMFFGIITGIEKLHFVQLNEVLMDVLGLSGRIFFGLVIIVLGNFLANIAYRSMSEGRQNTFVASIARIAILGLFLGISLHEMGIADHIVNLAFGLTLGAVAVAVALSFGLGGREAAGKQMEHILRKIRGEE